MFPTICLLHKCTDRLGSRVIASITRSILDADMQDEVISFVVDGNEASDG